MKCPPAAGAFLFENHDHALQVWREAGVRARVLVHVDAHHDLNALVPGGPLTVANFVSAAIREGIVREVFWVIPDGAWSDGGSRAAVERNLRRLARKHGPPVSGVESGADCIRTRLAGTPLTVCTLSTLPSVPEEVLLDIDTDFLIIPKIRYGAYDAQGALPWCWPEELLSRLGEARLAASIATIAYSAEGGYTPLKWKYLGEELQLRLAGEASGQRLRAAADLRTGAMAEAAGESATAEACYRRAQIAAPEWVAPAYRLALLLLDQGRLEEARRCYVRVIELDSSYRGTYSSAGIIRLWERRFDEAEREFSRVLQLDPDDGYALYGLAELACERGDYQDALVKAERSLQAAPELVDAHRVRGEILARLGRIEEAISAYETSLRLALEGHKPLQAGIMSDPQREWRLDPLHGHTHAELARLYARLGRTRDAIEGLRMSVGCAYDVAEVRFGLAANYARLGAWRKAALEAGRGLARLPMKLKWWLQGRWRAAKLDWKARHGGQE